ncbi:MAG: poly-gamma-glutamate synthesis protein (capsule biosynthesis protein) [Nonlabens sp.]|jgi:hypothetical protein|uniref:CapA family protein n=1 Tax=Nonlabens sp. TaxID=1888209 RepID=UPI0039E5E317
MRENTKLLFCGDLVIAEKLESMDLLEADLIEMFKESDFKIVNLEAPVTNSTSKILKTGPHIIANKESTLQLLQSLQVDVLTLANNHILDYDEKGVIDTLEFCKDFHIQSVGAGIDLIEASKILYLDAKDGIIAVINFAENEWSSATEISAGANPMDLIKNTHQINEARSKADYVFVVVHGGHEYYNLPSPRMQNQYRFYADQGADMVVGHHTHCISGNEVYNGVPIYYSLGNFLFTGQKTFKDWYIGLILEVEIIKGKLSLQLHPIKQEEVTGKLNLIQGDEKQLIFERIKSFNAIINDHFKLNAEWDKFVKTRYTSYLNFWSPVSFISNRYVRGVLSKLGITGSSSKGMALKLNLIRCEAHSDLSKDIIKKYLNR